MPAPAIGARCALRGANASKSFQCSGKKRVCTAARSNDNAAPDATIACAHPRRHWPTLGRDCRRKGEFEKACAYRTLARAVDRFGRIDVLVNIRPASARASSVSASPILASIGRDTHAKHACVSPHFYGTTFVELRKREECRSGRSSTLGKSTRLRVLTHVNVTYWLSVVSSTNRCIDVPRRPLNGAYDTCQERTARIPIRGVKQHRAIKGECGNEERHREADAGQPGTRATPSS